MPAVSKQQFKLMAAVASGNAKISGMTPSKADEYIHGVNYKKLPRFKKLKDKLKVK